MCPTTPASRFPPARNRHGTRCSAHAPQGRRAQSSSPSTAHLARPIYASGLFLMAASLDFASTGRLCQIGSGFVVADRSILRRLSTAASWWRRATCFWPPSQPDHAGRSAHDGRRVETRRRRGGGHDWTIIRPRTPAPLSALRSIPGTSRAMRPARAAWMAAWSRRDTTRVVRSCGASSCRERRSSPMHGECSRTS